MSDPESKPNYVCNKCGWKGRHTETTTVKDTLPVSGLTRVRRACPKCRSTNLTFLGAREDSV